MTSSRFFIILQGFQNLVGIYFDLYLQGQKKDLAGFIVILVVINVLVYIKMDSAMSSE
jgi:hypothetical protein